MAGTARFDETASRGARMLRTALGPAIATFLQDSSVVEVMLNPDGRLWIDRLKGGLEDTGERLSPPDGERIVRLVAHHIGTEVHPGSPRVSAELPETGERFEGLIPPRALIADDRMWERDRRRVPTCTPLAAALTFCLSLAIWGIRAETALMALGAVSAAHY